MHALQRLHHIIERLFALLRQTPPRLQRQELGAHGGTSRDPGYGEVVNHATPP
jgi:hypothetical protein